jgi:hypothetical protein
MGGVAVQSPRMKRFRRWLFNILMAMCMAIIVMWARGYWVSDWIGFQKADIRTNTWTGYGISSQLGTVWASYESLSFSTPQILIKYATGLRTPGLSHQSQVVNSNELAVYNDTFLHRRGFALVLERNVQISGAEPYSFTLDRGLVPDWLILLIVSMPCDLALIRFYRRAKRTKHGKCLICGYDLRATPDRCPECGTIPPKKEVISN